jgi:BolA family transcriptional regulator, general stress-responsive regulator
MMQAQERIDAIYQQLQNAFQPQVLEVIDESHLHVGHTGHQGAGHFAIVIAAEAFKGKTLIERHRMVYEALANLMGPEIHALRIKAILPDEQSL